MEQRGSPPESARNFRLPQSLLLDALAAWELLQMLAPTLQVLVVDRQVSSLNA